MTCPFGAVEAPSGVCFLGYIYVPNFSKWTNVFGSMNDFLLKLKCIVSVHLSRGNSFSSLLSVRPEISILAIVIFQKNASPKYGLPIFTDVLVCAEPACGGEALWADFERNMP